MVVRCIFRNQQNSERENLQSYTVDGEVGCSRDNSDWFCSVKCREVMWYVVVGYAVCCRSAVKVISQPNPQFGQGSDNPLSVLGQALFPAGSTNAPMEQLQQFYRLGVQAMSKAQSAGGETRSNSTASVTTGVWWWWWWWWCRKLIYHTFGWYLVLQSTVVIWLTVAWCWSDSHAPSMALSNVTKKK